MGKLAQQLGGQSQVKCFKKGGLVEGSKKEEAMDRKQGVVAKKCGGSVKKGKK